MTARTTSKILTFRRPFKLSGVDDMQPAGNYVVETDEEQLDTSVLAYRRLATLIRLPGTPGTAEVGRVIDIDPRELEAVLIEEHRCRKRQRRKNRPGHRPARTAS